MLTPPYRASPNWDSQNSIIGTYPLID